MTIVAVLLATAIGLTMGVLGAGGSLVAIPALSFVLHLPPKTAVVTSLAIVGTAAAAGAASSLARGVLPLGVALIVGVSSMLGAYAGGIIGAALPDRVQLAALGVIMLSAALAIWRRPAAGGPARCGAHPVALVILGVAIGVVTGLVGVGGGFLIVPALVICAGVPMRQAAATSLFVITLTAAAAIPGYLGRMTFDWAFIGPFAAVTAMAAVAGSLFGQYLPQRRLQQVFAAALVVLGSYVLTR
jgi:uncharacterized membrane protein YfcA